VSAAIVAGGLSFLVAGALVPLLVRFAVGRNLLDVPNLRSSHEVPTPRLGGVAIVVGAAAGVAVLRPEAAWPLLLAAALVGLVGLADDLSNLHFGPKAAAQAVAAAALIFFYPPPVLAGASGALYALVFGVGVFWVVALCNAYNFMDGIDGFIGGVALVNILFLAALGGAPAATLPALAGAAAGFLVWNINPASIFLGDAGSYFLGFFLAAVALYAPVEDGWSPLPFLACALVFTPLLFDTGYTLVARLVAGKNVLAAHREHVYQRITPSSDLHRRTSNLYYGASVVAGFSALLVARGGAGTVVGGLLALALCAGIALLPYLVHGARGASRGGRAGG
jgi:UDP-N-acetylmuramyl pentapeptide phosphotransferase/UDP-N-acetylglucosamine-1-phosphate transferase